jgi:UDP-glucose 4-epimerase
VSFKNKKILITGGAGFIGSHIVESVVDECESVIIYDNFTSGTKENLNHLNQYENLKIIKGDILDMDKLKENIDGVDFVSHHAAELEVYTGITNMHHDSKINIEGTLNVLKACMDTNVKKMTFASSGAVYGQAQKLPEAEEHPLEPHWPYGVSKLAAEKYCKMAWKLYGFPTTSFRYGIVYGPREWYGRVLTLFIKRCLEGKSPVIFGDGNQTRDFVYVSDIVKAHNICLENSNSDGEVFNIGSGKSTSIKELAELVIELTNSNLQPIFDNPPEGEDSKHQPGRKRLIGDLVDFTYDISFSKKIIDYKPSIEFRDGVKEEINWVKENMERWNVEPRV